jgi:hypothetical protein
VLVSDMSRPGLRSPNLVVPMACSWVCTSRASSFRESVTASGGRLAGLAAGGRQRGPGVVAAHGQLAQRRGTRPTQVGIHAVVDSVRGHPRPVPGPDRVRVLVVHILQRRPVRLPDRVQVGLDHWSRLLSRLRARPGACGDSRLKPSRQRHCRCVGRCEWRPTGESSSRAPSKCRRWRVVSRW